jgi:hypothetical protein
MLLLLFISWQDFDAYLNKMAEKVSQSHNPAWAVATPQHISPAAGCLAQRSASALRSHGTLYCYDQACYGRS